ncbi:putative HMP/thiamine permease protein YkoC [Halobacillus andaensis]|uniref:HMP/thiamine permease protein YkoC n=1 Tax=Halobacillus andaensis TaxID=1176239 RepID=A0A917B7R7_HALAA|nr:energy-coupling factor transporter transmembrane component T [Halobacillus andaensis]MBP2006108.1 energy-coupling factor transport system permease protein [Halobacillus andaensis]GGF23594.1 putative HMP/thiamine permease protein YkoC [Halobacillus andaensis]
MCLHNVNPSVKALTILGLVFVLAFLFDPITPLLFIIWTLLLTMLFGSFRKKYYFLYFFTFFIFAAGMLWSTIAFADTPKNPADQVSWAGWEVPKEDLFVAISLSLRILAFATLSLLFMFTTNMVHFILSLIQQLKLPPKLAYGILAGYRFLPLMKTEFQQIRAAHRIRGMNQATSLKEKMKQYKRFVIPLLAGAIRKAERTAIAMESKGFTGDRNRTYYHNLYVTKKDWLFPIIMFTALGVFITLSIIFDYFAWYNGQL